MNFVIRTVVLCSAAVVAFAGPARAQREKPTLTVLAAISLRDAMADVARDFERANDARVELVFGASGQLASQVETGATADVFVSAAEAQVDRLVAAKHVDPATRRVVAGNVLVLVVPATATTTPTDFRALANAEVRRVAIGEPKSVPVGTYAAQAFAHLKLEIADKLVYGANVKQVLDYVARGEVDAGVVYATDVVAAGDAVRVVARADASWHAPIRYPAVVVSASRQPALAAAFVTALASDQGQATLRTHGFEPAPATAPATMPATQPGGR